VWCSGYVLDILLIMTRKGTWHVVRKDTRADLTYAGLTW
jgi:hypothetical protein